MTAPGGRFLDQWRVTQAAFSETEQGRDVSLNRFGILQCGAAALSVFLDRNFVICRIRDRGLKVMGNVAKGRVYGRFTNGGLPLAARHVFVVEYDIQIGWLIENILDDAHCAMMGPVTTLTEIIETPRVQKMDLASLDVDWEMVPSIR
ncbi:hypothetical protein [Acidisoma silvae]|uniref:Uncharacterized protein n=1 Tax=Acidisoma silvae TaxID=2802396 RepID=A0A963YUL3_9PROT|nr:hypothetical protein [Acidisoma silvae]MCB8877372.1 hypothetical protein [Acidisoma silvae]